jgi:hypothetical protein
VYTLASAVLFGGDTKLIFNETISDNAGDGVLYKDE